MNIKIGFGFDVHQLEEGKPFWLGGVQLESKKGAVGHSDADVLIHAICDALLGALALRDIGHHFPNTNPKYKGIDSKKLLAEVMTLIKNQGYKIGNVDSTICLEKPKVNPSIDLMKNALCLILEVEDNCLSIKATTNETLGFIGREEGVTAYAVALLIKTS